VAMIDRFKGLLEEAKEQISQEEGVLLKKDFAKAKTFRDKI